MEEPAAAAPPRSKTWVKTPTNLSADALGFNYRVTWYLLYCGLWGGFIHFNAGYDIGVAGGLFTKESFLARFYPDFKGSSDSPYCKYTSFDLALYSAMLSFTMVPGTFLCGYLVRYYGRIRAYHTCAWLNIIGAIVQITAKDSSILLVGRAICGLGEGFGYFVFNLYQSEIAPAQLRGKFVGSVLIWSSLGITLGQLTNFLVKQREDGWQIAIAMIIVPSALITINALFMKDTPISLLERAPCLMRGKSEAAHKSLQKYRGVEDVDAELRSLELSVTNRTSTNDAFKLLFSKKKYWPGVIINVAIYTLLNWTGNKAIVYYGPQIFSLLGMGSSVALWNAALVGGAKILGVFIGMYFMDTKLTRRSLLQIGGIGQAVFLIGTAVLFATSVDNVKGAQVSKGIAAAILVMIFMYEIIFMGFQDAPSLGLAAEMVPIEVRPATYPIVSIFCFPQSVALSISFTYQLCAMLWGTFLFMASFALLLFVWGRWFQPETHLVPIERVPTVLKAHPVWRHFYPPEDVEEAERELEGTANPSPPISKAVSEELKGSSSNDGEGAAAPAPAL
ncbi:sugar transport 14-like [Micractinium conductrix]|uniref:Sugar transport 14-like n=1 Tax=Micractinium conductrix TaxID=554055 RepID=A0A2P6V2V7_9CHLO|nr:sugar transport 14-like [Micractinium conductrix]|eukprot:PSC68422.1 sugar transport 14-like [Micractinium conductrix]